MCFIYKELEITQLKEKDLKLERLNVHVIYVHVPDIPDIWILVIRI